MVPRHFVDVLKDQRGVALPLAMLALIVMTVLVIGFSVMSASEPAIANNQMRVAQARAIAEAGMERAIWALNNSANVNGIPNIPPPAPYDGGTLVNVAVNGNNVGGFRVTVSNGGAANERNIVSDGWVPNDTATNRAKQRITVTVFMIRFLDPPAALAVAGELDVSGNSAVDSRADTSCGAKAGSITLGTTQTEGAGKIYGSDGNNTANQATDALQNQPRSVFDQIKYSNDELNMLKELAKANGTYYQGTQNFNAGNQLHNGVVYIDTVSGQNIDQNGPNTTDSADFANVTIHGNSEADASGVFSGWLIVAGSLSVNGNFHMHGLIYAVNDMSYVGTGTGQVDGAVITQNIRDTSTTSIDTNTGGNALIVYNCNYAKTGGGQVPQTFRIKPGTYREVSG